MKSNNAISKIGQSREIYTFSPNLASATNNDIASCKATSYVVFFVLGCDKSATKILYFCKLYCKRLKS